MVKITHAYVSRNITETVNKMEVNQTIEDASEKGENSKESFNNTNASNITEQNDDSQITIDNTIINLTDVDKVLEDNISKSKLENPELLKYVHKKTEKYNPDKSTGSSMNKLKRKRRSNNLETLDETNKPPTIVNIETQHPPLGNLQREGQVWLLARNTANVIKNSDLADFNIETLHDDGQPIKSVEPTNNALANSDSSESSNESSDKESYRDNRENIHNDSGERNERENVSNENDQYPQKSSENYSDSEKDYENKNIGSGEEQNSSTESSNENNDSRENEKSRYFRPVNNGDESRENYSGEVKKNIHKDVENVGESFEEKSRKYKSKDKSPYKAGYDTNPSTLNKIVDVDLADYEKIVVNKNGEVEAANDNYKNRDTDSSGEVISSEEPRNIGTRKSDKISELPREGSSSLESVEHNEPTHINDGEVKPVVEINTDSTETSDESSDELNAKLENESLETLTGVNEQDSNEKSDKLQNNPQNQGDVKQQFERIPLNYNHAIKQNKDVIEESSSSKPEQENDEEEGTLDKVKPRYDEHLNIKFDNIYIKLPEIKLPEDILSYAHEDPPVYNKEDEREEQVEKPNYYRAPQYYQPIQKEKDIPRFYHYSDEVRDEAEDNGDVDDNNKNQYRYYGSGNKNAAYKQKEKQKEDDEDDDLYEKFVREKFGKRGTFKNRLEKLTAKPYNPVLSQKVQNILKKAEDVKSEAAKSGDPKAGFMWTLEYGEQL